MELIKKAYTILIGRTVKGTNFVKGDYIALHKFFMALTNKGRQVELSHSKILNFVGGVRITEKKLNTLKGQNVEKFIQTQF